MTRLIDADALLKELDKMGRNYQTQGKILAQMYYVDDVTKLVTNAPTVEREGWVSVPIEPVAWKRTRKSNGETEYFTDREYKHETLFDWIPLYAAPKE